MKMKHLGLLVTATLMFGACETMNSVSDSISGMFSSKEETQTAESKDVAETIVAADKTQACPSVQIMADLKEMQDFTDFSAPSDTNRISRIEIRDVKAGCKEEPEALAMTIDITFDGQIGPKARAKKSDTANFSYPYFVAVTDADGKILAKEIFAASVSYSSGQDTIKQIETINQLLPKTPGVADYTVLLGFQLNENQLMYNRANMTPAAGEAQPLNLE